MHIAHALLPTKCWWRKICARDKTIQNVIARFRNKSQKFKNVQIVSTHEMVDANATIRTTREYWCVNVSVVNKFDCFARVCHRIPSTERLKIRSQTLHSPEWIAHFHNIKEMPVKHLLLRAKNYVRSLMVSHGIRYWNLDSVTSMRPKIRSDPKSYKRCDQPNTTNEMVKFPRTAHRATRHQSQLARLADSSIINLVDKDETQALIEMMR